MFGAALTSPLRFRRVLVELERRKDGIGAGVPKDSAIVKLLDGVKRSSSLASEDSGDPGSASLGLE